MDTITEQVQVEAPKRYLVGQSGRVLYETATPENLEGQGLLCFCFSPI